MSKTKSVRNEEGYIGSVKVGAKGQIVIPKEVRDMFRINPGDSLMIVASPGKGIGMHRAEYFYNMATEIMSSGSAGDAERGFAEVIGQVKPDDKDE